MGKGAIPTTHKLYIGNIGIHGNYASNHAICDCDVLFQLELGLMIVLQEI